MSADKTTFEKLKRILKVSNSIKMEQMRKILRLDEEIFNEKIIDWAEEFDFIIERDYINFNKNTVDSFINLLDEQFDAWEKMETTKNGKIEKFESDIEIRLEPQQKEFEAKEISEKGKEYEEYFVNLGKKYLKSKQYQEALSNFQQARKVSENLFDINLTIEADYLIKQTENLIKEAQQLRNIISFKGAYISEFEELKANVIQELETQLKEKFTLVSKIEWDTKMGFSVKDHRITGIGLYECGLTTLPESISNLSSLKVLYLGWNEFKTVPESIGDLSSLKELNLNHNKLTTLPESIGNLKSLENLDLSTNKFTTLPELIGDLSSLKELNLQYNKLTTLPKSIGNLKSLENLDLSINKLTTLLESIENLKSLENLDLSTNKFTTLPESIGDLSSLKELDLRWNKLTTLPETMMNLTFLKTLYISKSTLDSKAKSVLKQLKKKQKELEIIKK